MRLLFRLGLIVLSGTVALICMLFLYFTVVSKPICIQKAFSIEFASPPSYKEQYQYGKEQQQPVNAGWSLVSVISAIPYHRGADSERNLFVESSRRVQRSLKEGSGNCIDYSMALGVLLKERSKPFQIIDILPYDGFLKGSGHTLISMDDTLFRRPQQIVDVQAGCVLLLDGQTMGLNDLVTFFKKREGQLGCLPLIPEALFQYYFFKDKSLIGERCYADVCRFLDYTDKIYMGIFSPSFEMSIYNGIALVFGYYPPVYVRTEEKPVLFSNRQFVLERIFASMLIYLVRGTIFLVVLLVVLFIINKWRGHKVCQINETNHTGY